MVHSKITLPIIALLILCSLRTIAQQIPANTPIEIRLTRRIATHKTPKGSPVEAILIAPILSGDQVLLPTGSKVLGTIANVNSVGLGFRHETASIAIHMDHIVLPDGTSIPLTAHVAQIENSREVINKKGSIQGVRSTSTLSHRASGAVGTLAFSNPIALIFTTASSASVLRFSDPEISLPANAELILLTTEPITIAHSTDPTTPALTDSPADRQALRNLIRRQPFRTVTDRSHVPSDITNLMFIGDPDGILRAFTAAGWLQVSGLDAASTYRTVRSISEQQAYRTAPMSTLLLEGRAPAHTLAKTLDTFSKRHHLRIYATSEKWEGQPVFVSSSTQDIGIGFSLSQKNFIHQIDHNIDHERTKVVNDLMLTGCVTGLNIVARSWLPKDPKNGTGEPILTDGRMAVLRIDACKEPLHVPALDQTDAAPIHTSTFTHVTRQTVLTLRNTLLRDNIGVSVYSGIRTAINARHPKPPEQPLETSSEIAASRYAIGVPNTPAEDTPTLHTHEDEPASGTVADSKPTSRFPPSTIELGIHGGFAGYVGGNGGGVGYILQNTVDPLNNPLFIIALANDHHNGWNIGGSVTVNAHRYFSNEFNFDYNRTGFSIGFASLPLNIGDGTSDPSTENSFTFDEATLSTTEVSYNLLVHARPKGTRFRPYLSVGPSLRLMHLTDAPITKASPWFKLGLTTVGALTAAYHFGSTPPLDGGGIFQVGLQYGAGFKYRIARRWLIRADYKETLTSQPDFWSKSSNEIYNDLALPNYTLTVVGPLLEHAMRQQRATTGISFVF